MSRRRAPGISAVTKVAKSGGTPVTLISGQSNSRSIAVDATSLYWTDGAAVWKLTPK